MVCKTLPEEKLKKIFLKEFIIILIEEFINLFSKEMDKTKLCNIKSGINTSNNIGECLLAIFEREKKIWMVKFKERITEKDPISIFSIQKKKNLEVLKVQ